MESEKPVDISEIVSKANQLYKEEHAYLVESRNTKCKVIADEDGKYHVVVILADQPDNMKHEHTYSFEELLKLQEHWVAFFHRRFVVRATRNRLVLSRHREDAFQFKSLGEAMDYFRKRRWHLGLEDIMFKRVLL